MSKKAKTTGLPTPTKHGQLRSGRVYHSRAEREAAANRAAILISGVLAGVILVILGVAVMVENVFRPNTPVASAGSQSISISQFQERVRYERWLAGWNLRPFVNNPQLQQFLASGQAGSYGTMYQNLQIPQLMGQETLSHMIDGMVLRQYAAANNITVSQEEVDKQIHDFFGFDPNDFTPTPSLTPTLTLTPLVSATPSPTQTPTVVPSITATPTFTPFPTGVPTATPGPTERFQTFEEDRKTYYEAAAELSGASDALIREVFTEAALREKVLKAVLGEPPKEQEQIRVRRIVVGTEAEAQDVLKALQAGEPFASLASAVSTDSISKSDGGLLDWEARGTRAAELDDALWNAPVGQVIGPINVVTPGNDTGFNIFQVIARENRELTEGQQQELQAEQFADWLNRQREAQNAQTYASWLDSVPSRPTLTDLGLPESLQ